MRDIRDDLRERKKLMEEQVRLADVRFEKLVKQLQAEREAKVSGLKMKIAMVGTLIDYEDERVGQVAPKMAKTTAKPVPPKLSLAAAG
jgi:hypothetical protein